MAVIALCLWVVAAWRLMVTLTPRHSWPAAFCLAAAGLPIVVWLGWTMGSTMGWAWALPGAAVMALVLRWPLRRPGGRVGGSLCGWTGRRVE